ncbi:hypothetical protein GL305_13810 [Nocardia seriolae]|nr:hypothetical protein [Nocardia seriolae]MTJ72312.1 hypothetical protein [Nocardia seriolae]MTJ87031.1 hypothetical protein [Nocardia seriolae]MTK31027.1 hypothetical protein [Nocardia seriolae]MTK40068.1 hypothetical protein [Nocardia seriolae]
MIDGVDGDHRIERIEISGVPHIENAFRDCFFESDMATCPIGSSGPLGQCGASRHHRASAVHPMTDPSVPDQTIESPIPRSIRPPRGRSTTNGGVEICPVTVDFEYGPTRAGRMRIGHPDRMSDGLRLVIDVLDRLGRAALLVDGYGRVQHMNAAAHEIVDRSDGLSTDRGGVLSAVTPRDRAVLAASIAGIRNPGRRSIAVDSMMVVRPSNGRHYVLHILPIHRNGRSSARPPIVLVTVVEPDDSGRCASVDTWRTLYGLTPREAAVAEQVQRGEGLQTVADTLAVTLSTVRAHLQHVFEKTHTHRQAELARLLTVVEPIFDRPPPTP